MEKVVSYLKYEKISDSMMFLGNNTMLKFNVKLSKKGSDGRRYHYHKEYVYPSNYINEDTLCTIKRDFEFYLSIESLKDKDLFCMITVSDILLLRSILRQTSKWLDGTIETFAIKRDKLIVLGKHDPISMTLCIGKTIGFEPIIIVNSNDIQSQGIRMTIDNNYIDISANIFMGFVYLINTIDMFACAQTMINYLACDTVLGSHTVYISGTEPQEETINVKKRFPPKQDTTGGSFFSNMNKLDDM